MALNHIELSLSDGDPLSSNPRKANANGGPANRGTRDRGAANGDDSGARESSSVERSLERMRRKRKQPPSPIRTGAPKSPQHQVSPNRQKALESVETSVSRSNLFSEDYTTRVKKKRRCTGCWNLSVFSWIFLILAFVQAVIVTGLQIVIVVMGDFRSEPAEDYVECTAESLNISSSLLKGTSIPSFGEDKEIYIYLFITLVVYNFFLCLYAMKFRNILEVFAFLVINVLTLMYASFQVYQFRGFGDECELITTVGYYALGNVLVLFAFTIVFGMMSFFIYLEFGWKLYREVRCDSEIRHYYKWYEMFMSGTKLLILFTVIYSVGQCILLLQDNYETWLTILLVLAIIASYPIVYFIVHRETHVGSVLVLIGLLLLVVYFIFKVVRYSQRSCPVCEEVVEESDRTRDRILNLTNMSISDIDELIRGETFEHLVMFGVINAITTIVTIVVFVRVWTNYGKGLREKYFKTQQPVFKCCARITEETDGREQQRLFLRLWSSRRKKSKSTRDSQLSETFSPVKPDFNLAPSTTGTTADAELGVQGNYKPRSATLPPIREDYLTT